MITLLHGDEEFTRSEALASLRRRVLGEDDLGGLNLAVLSPPPDLAALRDHADTLPFLGEKRLVVVRGWLEALAREMARGDASARARADALAEYLDHIPESTHLVFVEDVRLDNRHPVLQRIRALAEQGQAEEHLFVLPHNARERREFVLRWLRDRAREMEIELAPEAASHLAEVVGNDLRLLHQELTKLRTYAGAGGFITREDVERLVPYTGEANIFHMIRAIGEGDARRATIILQQTLAAGQHPLQILALLARQYRIYIGLKDLAEQGRPHEEIAHALRIPPWSVRRDLRIAQRMSWRTLERIMERLLETDVAIKQGEIDATLAVQLLVVRLALAAR